MDLARVERELAGTIDELIAGQLAAQAQRLTMLVAVGYMAAVAFVAVAVRSGSEAGHEGRSATTQPVTP